MLFNSLEFLIYLIAVFAGYWALHAVSLRAQNLFLLAVSYLFYGWWDWRFLGLIIGISFVNWYAALWIDTEKGHGRRVWMVLALVANFGVLGYFKYTNFFIDSLNAAVAAAGGRPIRNLNIILPVGISFITFQGAGYMLDVYFRKVPATRNPITFCTFIAFFPQLVAGPIERATHLLPQFCSKRTFSEQEAIHGVNLMAYGLFKKVVVADRLAGYVTAVYANPAGANSVSAALATLFFAFQIYCDFSGYSDMARGMAKLFGFDVMVNFRRPYLAASVPEFWARWHISLSTWFKDYLYIPLGGNRKGFPKWVSNVLIVFLVSGIWHGANWTFVIWGAIHAVFQVIGGALIRLRAHGRFVLRPAIERWVIRPASVGATFAVVTLAWVFFRAGTTRAACAMIARMCALEMPRNAVELFAAQGPFSFAICFLVIGLLLASYALPFDLKLSRRRSFVTSLTLLLTVFFLGRGGNGEFIYFQF